MPHPASEVVVVGAGIAGCFSSYFLARRGIQVTLVDRSGVGRQASRTNPGGLNPLHGAGLPGPMSSFAMSSFRHQLELWDAIAEQSGIDFFGRIVHRMLLAFEGEEIPELDHAAALYDAADGFSARRLTPAEALEMEPRLNPSVVGAVLTHGNGCVDGGRYTDAVARAAVALGATIEKGEVRGLVASNGRITEVETDAGRMPCGAVVIATGPWSAGPAEWLNVDLPIRPVKGELLVVSQPGDPLALDLTWGGAALYPTPDGSIWLGGTEEDAGFDVTPTPEGRTRIMDGVARIMPSIRDVTVTDHVAGLRPVSRDGFPVVGRAPGWDNVYLAIGAGRKGMLLGAGMGKAVADLIADCVSDLDLESCAPERFR